MPGATPITGLPRIPGQTGYGKGPGSVQQLAKAQTPAGGPAAPTGYTANRAAGVPVTSQGIQLLAQGNAPAPQQPSPNAPGLLGGLYQTPLQRNTGPQFDTSAFKVAQAAPGPAGPVDAMLGPAPGTAAYAQAQQEAQAAAMQAPPAPIPEPTPQQLPPANIQLPGHNEPGKLTPAQWVALFASARGAQAKQASLAGVLNQRNLVRKAEAQRQASMRKVPTDDQETAAGSTPTQPSLHGDVAQLQGGQEYNTPLQRTGLGEGMFNHNVQPMSVFGEEAWPPQGGRKQPLQKRSDVSEFAYAFLSRLAERGCSAGEVTRATCKAAACCPDLADELLGAWQAYRPEWETVKQAATLGKAVAKFRGTFPSVDLAKSPHLFPPGATADRFAKGHVANSLDEIVRTSGRTIPTVTPYSPAIDPLVIAGQTRGARLPQYKVDKSVATTDRQLKNRTRAERLKQQQPVMESVQSAERVTAANTTKMRQKTREKVEQQRAAKTELNSGTQAATPAVKAPQPKIRTSPNGLDTALLLGGAGIGAGAGGVAFSVGSQLRQEENAAANLATARKQLDTGNKDPVKFVEELYPQVPPLAQAVAQSTRTNRISPAQTTPTPPIAKPETGGMLSDPRVLGLLAASPLLAYGVAQLLRKRQREDEEPVPQLKVATVKRGFDGGGYGMVNDPEEYARMTFQSYSPSKPPEIPQWRQELAARSRPETFKGWPTVVDGAEPTPGTHHVQSYNEAPAGMSLDEQWRVHNLGLDPRTHEFHRGYRQPGGLTAGIEQQRRADQRSFHAGQAQADGQAFKAYATPWGARGPAVDGWDRALRFGTGAGQLGAVLGGSALAATAGPMAGAAIGARSPMLGLLGQGVSAMSKVPMTAMSVAMPAEIAAGVTGNENLSPFHHLGRAVNPAQPVAVSPEAVSPDWRELIEPEVEARYNDWADTKNTATAQEQAEARQTITNQVTRSLADLSKRTEGFGYVNPTGGPDRVFRPSLDAMAPPPTLQERLNSLIKVPELPAIPAEETVPGAPPLIARPLSQANEEVPSAPAAFEALPPEPTVPGIPPLIARPLSQVEEPVAAPAPTPAAAAAAPAVTPGAPVITPPPPTDAGPSWYQNPNYLIPAAIGGAGLLGLLASRRQPTRDEEEEEEVR
jgi:hypothetical protein